MERDDTTNIAVFETVPDEAEFISTELRNAGLAVIPFAFTSNNQLEDILIRNRIDLIFCSTDDEELSPTCQIADHHKDHIPVIAVASDTDTASVVRAMNSGARDLVSRNQPDHLRLVAQRELRGIQHSKGMHEFKQSYQESEKRCRNLLDSSRDAIAYIHEGMHIYSNGVYVDMFGFEDKDDLEGLPILDMVVEEEHPRFKEFLATYDKQASDETVEIRCVREDGTEFAAAMQFSKASIDGEACTQVLIRDRAISEEVIHELEELKTHDPISGLYNRQAFLDETQQAINDVSGGARPGIILYVELDKFEEIKTHMGIENIDNVISSVGKLIKSAVDEEDFAARFGENTYTILTREGDLKNISKKAKKLIKALNTIIESGNKSLQITASLGLAAIRSTTKTPYEVLACADVSCSQAHKNGGNAIVAYKDPEKVAEKETSQDDLRWVTLLKNALENNLFKLAFQPCVSLKDSEEQIYEVLLRLHDENDEEIRPGDFLPAAEKTGMINLIDRWVIGRALHMLAEKQKEQSNTSLFIKLSGSAYNDESLLPWLYERSKASRIDPQRLIFEVAESDATSHISQVAKFSRTLKKMRCRIVISKFGVMDDPFKLLKTIPVDFIKLSSKLTGKIGTDQAMMERVTELVETAHDLEKQVLAPHVESAESMAVLFQCGLDFIQGNFLQEPDIVMQFDFGDNEASTHTGQEAVS
ncbi:MAG: EAL domain-containing protein [Gammaproteobacteria bacterium]|nr:EAL domain-containing protein [Gammaproteobacteria bacterium]